MSSTGSGSDWPVSFVVPFRGRRDGYQVPIALAERGLLDTFLTDQYYGRFEAAAARLLPARLAEKLRGRHDARLPDDRVKRLRLTALREMLYPGSPDALYDRFDPAYGLAAAAVARRHRSDLFLYSPYAMPALTARYRHDPRKIVFQYHPHLNLERRLLLDDLEKWERAGRAVSQQFDVMQTPSPGRIQSDESWRLADHIVCASSFTKRSLIEEGAVEADITVIPYGVELPPVSSTAPPEDFHVLFVGSGYYRKGLHHLLMAWSKARLPDRAKLTIVARILEPDLLPLIRATNGVDYRRGVDTAELNRLYGAATLFAMPSLVEGFGQVYLEALAHGLPVLGTQNTCVPDLGTAEDGLFCTPPGQSDALAAQLEQLADTLTGNADIRRRARAVAERHSWARFRTAIGDIAAGRPTTLEGSGR